MQSILAILSISLVLLAGAVWYLDKTEQQESHFETYQGLRSSELIEKGWVPDIVPRTAYNIYEEHRVDQDPVHVWFRFQPGDTANIQETCARQQSEDTLTATYKCKHGGGVVVVRLKQDGTGEIVGN
ncbi:hypothetical protein ACYX34_14775 [Nitrospira sp. CMX1]|nr:hypothetical protein [Nitrospira sp.]